MRRSVWSLLLASALLAGSVAATQAAEQVAPMGGPAASPAATSPRLVLSGDFSHGIALALDSSGHRHIVAGSRRGDLWYATDRTGSWTTKRLLTGREYWFSWSYPSVAMDEDDRVHIAVVKWEWTTPGSTSGIWYLTDAGRSRGDLGSPEKVAGNMMTSPALKVMGGVRYLAYAKCDCIPMQRAAPLSFRTDRSGSWVTERIADRGYDPSLRVGGDGRARIVYSDRKGLRYTRASTRSGDFSTPVRITGTNGLAGTPSLALDPSRREVVAWSTWKQGHPVFFTQRTSAGWTTPERLGHGTSAELSIDASGRPHVAVGWAKVSHLWLSGGTWRSAILADDADPMDVAIRAFGSGATIAWAQDVAPRGVWVSPG